MKSPFLKRALFLALLALTAVMLLLPACNSADPDSADTTESTPLPPDTSTVGGSLFAAGAAGVMRLDKWTVVNDPENKGIAANWKSGIPKGNTATITLPGAQTDVTDRCQIAWFYHSFKPSFSVGTGDRVLIQFGGVCYHATLYVNGREIGTHEGAYGTFTFDITDALHTDTKKQNLIALRVNCPLDSETFDGLKTDQLPIWNAVPKIQQSVYLYVKPEVRIEEARVDPSFDSGEISIALTLNNMTNDAQKVSLLATVAQKDLPALTADEINTQTVIPRGRSVQTLTLKVEDFLPWSPERPSLYTVSLSVGFGGKRDTTAVTTGFKKLTVDDEGYFNLNGARYFIKSSHTCTYIPGTIETAQQYEKYCDLIRTLKTCGFNTVRFLQSPALPQVLSFCDEIGMMVYQEHPLSWNKFDSTRTEELFDLSVTDILSRDRNHVSLSMFGMLNETEVSAAKTQMYHAAVNQLQNARAIAPNLLFLLSSGRWDGNLSLGSASNPGSTKWDGYMGKESSKGSTALNSTAPEYGLMEGMGDVHYYPASPYGSAARERLAQILSKPRAVFLSEAGAGSMSNIIAEYLLFSQNNTPTAMTAYDCLRQQVAELRAYFDDYGIDRIFATPEQMIEASEAFQTEQRRLMLTMIMRNEGINGYSMTMANDVGFRGEGVLEPSNGIKPGVVEMLQESLDDLRFCITPEKTSLYAGTKLDTEIVISNRGVLREGNYPVRIRIVGPSGTVFDKTVTVTAQDARILPVLEERIDTTDWQSGVYVISAEMLQGAHPTCGTVKITVTNKKDIQRADQTVYTLGASEKLKNLLTEKGALLTDFTPGMTVDESTVILVGALKQTDAVLKDLWRAAREGAHVILLDYRALGRTDTTGIPLPRQGKIEYFYNWLYHFDGIIFDTAATAGMPNRGIMDTDYWGDVYSCYYFTDMSVPTDIAVATAFVGIDGAPTRDFSGGFQLGTYAFGKGHLTVSTLNLVGGIGTPAADQIIMNLINYEETPSGAIGDAYDGILDTRGQIHPASGIRIDGKVSEEEWGTPIFRGVDVAACEKDAEDHFLFRGDKNKAQGASWDLYLNYDASYFYAAAVVHGTQKESASLPDAQRWKQANFGIMFSRYTPGTTVPRIEFNGETYEQYTHYDYYLLAGGTALAVTANEGLDWIDQVSADYQITYDEATQTLTYEVRIPHKVTNIAALGAGDQVAVSASVRLPSSTGNGSTGGALFLFETAITDTRGAYQTPMHNGSATLILGAKES